jgi:type II secretory pathway pseudopilin PulG
MWEALNFSIGIISIVAVFVVGWLQTRSDRRAEERQRKHDRQMEDLAAKTSRIDQLEQRLEVKAGELIELKLGTATHEIKTSVQILERLFAGIEKRLEKGDGIFGDLDDRVADARAWAIGTFATKTELDVVREKLASVRETLALLQGTIQ